jgi:hypothetical protein
MPMPKFKTLPVVHGAALMIETSPDCLRNPTEEELRRLLLVVYRARDAAEWSDKQFSVHTTMRELSVALTKLESCPQP